VTTRRRGATVVIARKFSASAMPNEVARKRGREPDFPSFQKMPTIHASSGALRNGGSHDFAVRTLD
jgi:hypothetical protein